MVIMLAAVVGYNTIILQTHAPVLDEYSRFLYKSQSLDRWETCLVCPWYQCIRNERFYLDATQSDGQNSAVCGSLTVRLIFVEQISKLRHTCRILWYSLDNSVKTCLHGHCCDLSRRSSFYAVRIQPFPGARGKGWIRIRQSCIIYGSRCTVQAGVEQERLSKCK